MKHVDKLQTTKEEIKILEDLIKDLYIKQRELLKKQGKQSWWDFFLELLGY